MADWKDRGKAAARRAAGQKSDRRRNPPGSNGTHPSPEATPAPDPIIEMFSASDLMRMAIPPPRWAVDGIAPEGLTILAGKPKLGKSWLALHAALAISSGGVVLGHIDVEEGDVLYLSLEDTKRRLQARIRKLLGPDEQPSWRLTLAHTWPRMGKGGLEAIDAWINQHQQARLVIIDTWVRFRPIRLGKTDSYEIDYADGTQVKELADKHGISVIIIHHCRKLGSADPLEEVSGSVGLTGACDGVLVLRRERGQHDATLFVTGRDVDEMELALSFDKQHCLWQLCGDAEAFRMSKARTEILDLFSDELTELSPKEIAKMTGKNEGAIRRLIHSMAKDGQLIPTQRGLYRRKPEPNPFEGENVWE